ncbi:MAG TPA: hypothetical protein VNT92_04280 [Acidimicrobiia bacterium]|nr:hypothetical protein [Acidimicrobiia bacterium]
MAEDRALVVVKTVHTAIWALVEAAMVYLLVSGAMRRSDRWAGIAGAVVAGETAVFLANGARCPLTSLAESLGAEDGSVTDIYLPGWLARILPAVHVPLVLAAVWLHRRNLSGREISGATQVAGGRRSI